jgi:hypothetical protein
MKLLSILAAATALMSGGAIAAPDIAPQATAQQIAELEGIYGLDNGLRARVFELDNRLYLEVGHDRKELTQVEPNRFMSRDGSVSLSVKPGDGGDKIVLGYRHDAQESIPIRLAAAKRPGRGSVD